MLFLHIEFNNLGKKRGDAHIKSICDVQYIWIGKEVRERQQQIASASLMIECIVSTAYTDDHHVGYHLLKS